jgi:hypothetical protein
VSRANVLGTLRERFDRRAWAELHGCNVARGHAGHEFLRSLARLWNIRVAGGDFFQYTDAGLEYSYI